MECPHREAYQSFISDSRLCNVFIAQGSFLSHGHTLGDLLLHMCVYIEKGDVFFRMRITDRCFGPYALVCV